MTFNAGFKGGKTRAVFHSVTGYDLFPERENIMPVPTWWGELTPQESWLEYVAVQKTLPFAAAPDLLEACKFYLHQYDSSHHGEDKGETPRRIRAAVAKAEGRGA